MLLRCLLLLAGLCGAHEVLAMRSVVNPMAPRVLHESAWNDDYSHGLPVLAGRAVDGAEQFSRGMFWLNFDVFDRKLLRPVAHGYAELPQFIREGTGNFFANLSEVHSFVDNLLLGRLADSGITLARFGINSTIGILGLFDPASAMGLERRYMTLATVMGKAGIDQGTYVMLPFYGTTTHRDWQGRAGDNAMYWFMPFWVSVVTYIVEGIHDRAQIIDQEGLIDNALDPYAQLRDVYLMYQEGRVGGGHSQAEEDPGEFDESFLDEIDG